MPAYYPTIPPNIQTWCLSQPLFFTATAPQHGSHINISPKGLPSRTLKIFSPSSCAYIDATGSGAETIAHVYENGRITVMFCSFEKTPRIVRFFCTGRVVEWWEPEFGRLGQRMGMQVEGARAVVVLSIWKVQTSCGYGVPLIDAPPLLPPTTPSTSSPSQSPTPNPDLPFTDRETLGHWAHKTCSANQLREYQAKWNAKSHDGCPGLKSARRDCGERLWVTDGLAWGRRVRAQREGLLVGFLVGVLMGLFFFGGWGWALEWMEG